MTIDKEELKTMAERLISERPGGYGDPVPAIVVPAADVLTLLAEIERLEAQVRLAGVAGEMAVHQAVGRAATDFGVAVLERDQLKAENDTLRKDAERYRFVRNPIGTSSPLAIWSEGKVPLFSGMADAVVDEFMAKEASHG